MQEGLSLPVAGPAAIFPRGYLWVAPVWYAAALAGLAVSRWPPLWFRLGAASGLLGAMLTFVIAVCAISTYSFRASQAGITLGLRSSTLRRGRQRRRVRDLSWRHVERVRLARRPGGTQIEFVLAPHATWPVRGIHRSRLTRTGRWLLLLIPFWYLLRPTGLTSPLEGPDRYRVVVRGASIDQLRHSLRVLAPPDVAIAVLVRKG